MKVEILDKCGRLMMPNGKLAKVGDVFDPSELGISEAFIVRKIRENALVETDKAATVTLGRTDTEAAADALEAHDGPTDDWTRTDIMEFLAAKGIEFDARGKKADLLEMAQSWTGE